MSGACNCSCSGSSPAQKSTAIQSATKTAKSVPSILLSTVIAFFPKCPLCWAVYMSMFSSVGLSRLPYMKWLLPVLVLLFIVHLYLLFKKVKQLGYLPFLFSICGAGIILLARLYLSLPTWLLFIGISLIIAGSLMNNFSIGRVRLKTIKN